MSDVNILIIGAGVVGLAIASKLSQTYSSIAVIDKYNRFGKETSSRSSEVIHAGIYYQPGSLKSVLCLRGNELIYDICLKNNIPHKNSGKLLIANDEKSIEKLNGLFNLAKSNGAKDCRIIDLDEINSFEPNIRAKKAIYFPSSGYVDSESLMSFFENNSIRNGVSFLYNQEVIGITKLYSGFVVKVKSGSDIYEFTCDILINSAGLQSGEVSAMAGLDLPEYKIHYHKGIYFRALRKLELYPEMLIYPIPPEEGSVGIHTTPDLNGGMRLGPHFIWSDKIDYSVDDSFHELFYNEVKLYLPFLEYNDIKSDMSGIMSSVQKPYEKALKDFIILNEIDKGYSGLINLIGIESPGLTAAPAIGEYINDIINRINE
ncbi:MAG: NAD(P)/FAD-dependent oxidoreductase [Candidatus Kapabacteria bacterium]|nr:NAD(P)/FAD-dependent oxidoreductase [Ignavibacteriota bacterium]MCW5883586.1 NAD(P)/FAD-dependent oxidoreductase [Candidatus Kapabacteria bacterium]